MKIVSFNIRYDNDDDGNNTFDNRKYKIKEAIIRREPDIIGFQEVLPHVYEWLSEHLENYIVVGCGRDQDFEDEHMIIAFKKSKFELLGLDNQWLSDTPRIPGSMFARQSILPRTMAIATLRNRKTRSVFKVINTHFDYMYEETRENSARLILDYIENEILPVILMGDLNAEPEDNSIKILNNGDIITDVSAGIESTFHNFNPIKLAKKIDYIFSTNEFEEVAKNIWDEEEGGVFLSDHFPVEVKVELK